MLTSIGALSYWIYNFEAINYRAGAETELDQWVAMIGVLATYIILFVIFGAFLEKSGAQRFFIDSPLAAAGHKIGSAGGFIMAELTGLPYSQIMLVAIFPALMYFFSVFMMVHYEAKKHNIVGERSKEKPGDILRRE